MQPHELRMYGLAGVKDPLDHCHIGIDTIGEDTKCSHSSFCSSDGGKEFQKSVCKLTWVCMCSVCVFTCGALV